MSGKQSRLRRSSRRDVNYIDRETSDEETMAEPQQEVRERGLLFTVALKIQGILEEKLRRPEVSFST